MLQYIAVASLVLSTQTLRAADLICTLSAVKNQWNTSQPALVTVELENVTDHAVDFSVIPTFYLIPKSSSIPPPLQPGYWAPTDLVKDQPLEVEHRGPHGDSIVPKSLVLHFEQRTAVTYRVDLQHTLWNPQISSMWPNVHLASLIVPGSYIVRLELGGKPWNVTCNEAAVQITRKPVVDQTPK